MSGRSRQAQSEVSDPLQTFTQRLRNYLQCLLVKHVLMADKSGAERKLTQRYGYDVDGSWTARSYAPAAILGSDWALEYPLPIPPRVHVGCDPPLSGSQYMFGPSLPCVHDHRLYIQAVLGCPELNLKLRM